MGNIIQSIPIQRLQGFRPSICFLACKSKISLWAQFRTWRDGNLVNVEWELTVLPSLTLYPDKQRTVPLPASIGLGAWALAHQQQLWSVLLHYQARNRIPFITLIS